MSLFNIIIRLIENPQKGYLIMSIDGQFNSIGGLIQDWYNSEARLKDFVDEVIQEKRMHGTYRTNAYRITLIQKNDEKKFLVENELMKLEGQPYDECFISPKDLKQILEIWIRERAEFEKNPEAYKEKLKKTGGIVEE